MNIISARNRRPTHLILAEAAREIGGEFRDHLFHLSQYPLDYDHYIFT